MQCISTVSDDDAATATVANRLNAVVFFFCFLNNHRRAATIVLKENNCHLLRVDKEHFNRILRDVEANTLRLQEHGKDVLVLERVAKQRGFSSAFK